KYSPTTCAKTPVSRSSSRKVDSSSSQTPEEGEGVMKNKLLIVTDLGLLKAYRLDATPQGTPRRLLSSLLAESPAGHETTPTRSLVGAPLQDAVRENASNVHLDPKHYPFKFRSESFGKMWWTATEDSSESSDVMLSHSTM